MKRKEPETTNLHPAGQDDLRQEESWVHFLLLAFSLNSDLLMLYWLNSTVYWGGTDDRTAHLNQSDFDFCNKDLFIKDLFFSETVQRSAFFPCQIKPPPRRVEVCVCVCVSSDVFSS